MAMYQILQHCVLHKIYSQQYNMGKYLFSAHEPDQNSLTKYWYWEEGTLVALFLIPHLEKDEDL